MIAAVHSQWSRQLQRHPCSWDRSFWASNTWPRWPTHPGSADNLRKGQISSLNKTMWKRIQNDEPNVNLIASSTWKMWIIFHIDNSVRVRRRQFVPDQDSISFECESWSYLLWFLRVQNVSQKYFVRQSRWYVRSFCRLSHGHLGVRADLKRILTVSVDLLG